VAGVVEPPVQEAARSSAELSSRHRAVLAAQYVGACARGATRVDGNANTHAAPEAAQYARGRPRSGPVKASGATLMEARHIASNRAVPAASRGERCKRCNACGNSPGSDARSNSSLNSGSAAASSEYRYRVPKSAIDRSQSWRQPRSALKFDGPAVAGRAQENARSGPEPDIDLAATALR
jgi:hypothetical protein